VPLPNHAIDVIDSTIGRTANPGIGKNPISLLDSAFARKSPPHFHTLCRVSPLPRICASLLFDGRKKKYIQLVRVAAIICEREIQ
jgi:hypothetical protein